MTLVHEMPASAVARFVGVTDKRIWRIAEHYVTKALARLDLSALTGLDLGKTASKRGHNCVTVFIDLDRKERPIIFATPGKGKACLQRFGAFLCDRGGQPERVAEVVCDMSPAFLAAVGKTFENAAVTVDWFHVVQLFTKAVDNVRKLEGKQRHLPKGSRWSVLKAAETDRTEDQVAALREMIPSGFATAEAFRVKEPLRWVRHAETPQAAKWRSTSFLNHAREYILLEPVRKALATFEGHLGRILNRWHSLHTNARLEGLNGLFQAAKARARGYRNTATFITMIYLIAAPPGELVGS